MRRRSLSIRIMILVSVREPMNMDSIGKKSGPRTRRRATPGGVRSPTRPRSAGLTASITNRANGEKKFPPRTVKAKNGPRGSRRKMITGSVALKSTQSILSM